MFGGLVRECGLSHGLANAESPPILLRRLGLCPGLPTCLQATRSGRVVRLRLISTSQGRPTRRTAAFDRRDGEE